ncbi:5244_t:CDS:2 [Funneliformis caledonium]|uniref:5244_t:CDS:1 n=1 Tax=Funneliformis caledonium TaxID=1117310 RepID=A0A9N9B2N2_9GLOM|nr:5244_t:CDS:2 [Funneliformis caledonium]
MVEIFLLKSIKERKDSFLGFKNKPLKRILKERSKIFQRIFSRSKVQISLKIQKLGFNRNHDIFSNEDKEFISEWVVEQLSKKPPIEWIRCVYCSQNDLKNFWYSTQRQLTRESRAESQDDLIIEYLVQKDEVQNVEVQKDEVQNVLVQDIKVQKEVQKVVVQKDEVQKVEVQNVEVQNVEVQNVEVQKDEVQKVEVQNVEVQKDELQKVEVQKDEGQKDEVQKVELQKDEVQNVKVEVQKDKVQKVEVQKVEVQNVEVQKDEVQKVEVQKEVEVQNDKVQKDEVQKVEVQKGKVQKVESQKVEVQKEVEVQKDENKNKIDNFFNKDKYNPAKIIINQIAKIYINELFTKEDKDIIYKAAKDYLDANRDIQWKSIKTKIQKDPRKYSLNDLKSVWNSKQRQLEREARQQAREARAEVQDDVYLYDPSTKDDNYNYTTPLTNLIQKFKN